MARSTRPACSRARELSYAAERLGSVEINGSFYSLQRPSSYLSWAGDTPDDFVFAVKGSRFITHMKKLSDVRAPLANFLASGVLALGPKLGPMLWQLPRSLGFAADRLLPAASTYQERRCATRWRFGTHLSGAAGPALIWSTCSQSTTSLHRVAHTCSSSLIRDGAHLCATECRR